MPTSSDPPCILITNDDGIDAAGLAALADALAPLGDVVVVAPDRERSGSAHSLTLGRPLRVRERGGARFEVDGTPTDCVHLGVFNLTGGRAPRVVVSGINRGLNLSDDVTYSGTIAGALEGTLLHIPSIAISTAVDASGVSRYESAGRVARRLTERVLREGLPPGVLLNVNVPAGEPAGARITRQGSRTYRAAVVERIDPAGRPYFWIAGADTTPGPEPDGDHAAIRDGFVSITPLHVNLTHERSLVGLARWSEGLL